MVKEHISPRHGQDFVEALLDVLENKDFDGRDS